MPSAELRKGRVPVALSCDVCDCFYSGEFTGYVAGTECGDLSSGSVRCRGRLRALKWAPVLWARRKKVGPMCEVWCGQCHRWHDHSGEPGLRRARCVGVSRRHQYMDQYYLEIADFGSRDDARACNIRQFNAWVDFSQQAIAAVREVSVKETTVRIHKGADGSLALSTDASSEEGFVREFAEALSTRLLAVMETAQTVGTAKATDEWIGLLRKALPQFTEVVCKLRGYKAAVTERRVIMAGEFVPDDVVEVFGSSARTTPTAQMVAE